MNQTAGTPNFNLGHKRHKEDLDLFSWAEEEREPSPRKEEENSFTKWELDVKPLISSERWLHQHGLKRNKLKLHQILAKIGFKHTDSYVKSLKKPIGSYYGEGLFKQMRTGMGKIYNVTVGKETLRDIERNLKQSLRLIKRRQDWLTSGSRKIFGVVQEHCICIVLDVSTMVQSQFDLYREGICEVLQDQVSQLAKFNLIRAQSDMVMWQEKAVAVSDVTIKDAMKWVRNLDRMAEISNTSCTEAVVKACEDESLEAVYLFTEGDVSESSKELLRQKMKSSPIPLNTVSFNATKASTVQFLRSIAAETGGRFHAFVVRSKYEDDDDLVNKAGYPINGTSNIMSSMRLSQKTRGGLPHGAGVREEVFLIWQELEEARNILADMQALIANIESESEHRVDSQALVPLLTKRQETNLSSKDWLLLHGIDASKLSVFHALASYAFKHIDDVIEIQAGPSDVISNDAHQVLKLIEAKYCKNFPHMIWKNNEVVHVYVSAELFRSYERKMQTLLSKIQQRIDWLQQGSREVFGSILEERIYFLVDCSYSMGENLPVLKDRLMQLIHEQLRHKAEINFVKFESRASAWRQRLEEVTEDSLQSAWHWIRNIEPGGSTNTLAALRIALSDPNTEGIYLLTDGRPDQPLHCVLSQIKLRKPVPIHTISFNCHDAEANKFLHQLSLDTGGRYHCYTTHGGLPHGPAPFESEDIALLKAELERGREDLKKMSDLRARCVLLDWYYNRKSKGKQSDDKRVALRMSSPPPTAPCCVQQTKMKALPCPPPRNGTTIPEKPGFDLGLRSQPSLLGLSHKHHRGAYGVNDASIYTLTETQREEQHSFPKRRSHSAKQESKKKEVRKRSNKKKRDSDVPNSIWLKTNSLSARKMTIIDVLGPTIIRQHRKYVPIIDKHVLSKVFDEILPIAHVSPRSKSEIRLVNPNAAHLEAYERQLRSLLEVYRNRLNEQIWKHLSKEERERYGSKETFYYVRDPEYTMSDSNVKEEVDEILEENGWPIPKHEVQVLLDEIRLGEEYLQQSMDLRKAAAEVAIKGSKPQEDKGRPPRKKRPPKRRPRKDPSSPSESSSTSGSSEKSSSGRKDSDQDSNISKEEDSYRMQDMLHDLAGEKIVARSEFDGFYYDGLLMQCLDMRYAHVRFSHGEDQITSTKHILPLLQAYPLPVLKLSDHVLVRTRSTAKEPIHYIPGIIIKTPGSRKHSSHYQVLLCDNNKAKVLREIMIKIDKTRYTQTVQFIRERLDRLGCDLETDAESDSSSASSTPDKTSEEIDKMKAEIDKLQQMLRDQTDMIEKQREELLNAIPKPPPTPPVTHERMTSPVAFEEEKKFKDKGVVTDHILVAVGSNSMTITSGDDGVMITRDSQSKQVQTTQPGVPHQSDLRTEDEVLARFPDNGWYYRGTIRHIHRESDKYDVINSIGDSTMVDRGRVILDTDDNKNEISVNDKVVALHPSYVNSYAPGTVLSVRGKEYHIQFYDGADTRLPRNEVYLISERQYQEDVAYIAECEKKWEGQAVVARNDNDGQYHLACCLRRRGQTRRFKLQCPIEGVREQNLMHMFGAFSRKHDHFVENEHILAIADEGTVTYLPGKVERVNSDGTLIVKYINGVRMNNVDPKLSYFLWEDYYKQAKDYYHEKPLGRLI